MENHLTAAVAIHHVSLFFLIGRGYAPDEEKNKRGRDCWEFLGGKSSTADKLISPIDTPTALLCCVTLSATNFPSIARHDFLLQSWSWFVNTQPFDFIKFYQQVLTLRAFRVQHDPTEGLNISAPSSFYTLVWKKTFKLYPSSPSSGILFTSLTGSMPVFFWRKPGKNPLKLSPLRRTIVTRAQLSVMSLF